MAELAPHRLTVKKRETFLAALRQGYSVSHAATLIGLRRESLYEARQRDPDFFAAWEDATETGADRLEDEALRRAVEGTTKPVYYKSALIGGIQEYSDTLLIFLLKGRRPDKYAERHQHTHAVTAEAERIAAELGISVAEVLAEAERIVAGVA